MPGSTLVRFALLSVVAATFLFAGCDILEPAPRILDGWSVGDAIDCPATDRCTDLARVGLAQLDADEPGHPAVTAWSMHRESYYPSTKPGEKILPTRSGGCCSVLVVTLADGRVLAIGVGFPGVSQEPMAFRAGPALTMPGLGG